jgi:hypothetical protein
MTDINQQFQQFLNFFRNEMKNDNFEKQAFKDLGNKILKEISNSLNNLDIKTNNLDIKTNNLDIKTNDLDIKTNDLDIKTNDLDIKTNTSNKTIFENYIISTLDINTFQHNGISCNNINIDNINCNKEFQPEAQQIIQSYLNIINPNYQIDNDFNKNKLYLKFILIPFIKRCYLDIQKYQYNKKEQINIEKLYNLMRKYNLNTNNINKSSISYLQPNSNQNHFTFMNNLISQLENKFSSKLSIKIIITELKIKHYNSSDLNIEMIREIINLVKSF